MVVEFLIDRLSVWTDATFEAEFHVNVTGLPSTEAECGLCFR